MLIDDFNINDEWCPNCKMDHPNLSIWQGIKLRFRLWRFHKKHELFELPASYLNERACPKKREKRKIQKMSRRINRKKH